MAGIRRESCDNREAPVSPVSPVSPESLESLDHLYSTRGAGAGPSKGREIDGHQIDRVGSSYHGHHGRRGRRGRRDHRFYPISGKKEEAAAGERGRRAVGVAADRRRIDRNPEEAVENTVVDVEEGPRLMYSGYSWYASCNTILVSGLLAIYRLAIRDNFMHLLYREIPESKCAYPKS